MRPARGQGFTLVELMVTLGIAAVLLMIAAPSFKRIIISNRLTTAASTMVDAINFARLDAIKLNGTTQFCGSTAGSNSNDTLGGACGTQAGAVYALPQGATAAGQERAAPSALPASLQVGASGVAGVRFSGRGFGYLPSATADTPYTGDVAVICTTQLTTGNQRRITMSTGSTVMINTATGSCP